MRFEYVDVKPGAAGAWKADRDRNYCAWLLEGPSVTVEGPGAENVKDALMTMEVLVVPKGQDWGLSLSEAALGSSLVYLISGSITEASYPQEILDHFERASKRARTEPAHV